MINIECDTLEQQLVLLTLADSIVEKANQWIDYYGGHGDSQAIRHLETYLMFVNDSVIAARTKHLF